MRPKPRRGQIAPPPPDNEELMYIVDSTYNKVLCSSKTRCNITFHILDRMATIVICLNQNSMLLVSLLKSLLAKRACLLKNEIYIKTIRSRLH